MTVDHIYIVKFLCSVAGVLVGAGEQAADADLNHVVSLPGPEGVRSPVFLRIHRACLGKFSCLADIGVYIIWLDFLSIFQIPVSQTDGKGVMSILYRAVSSGDRSHVLSEIILTCIFLSSFHPSRFFCAEGKFLGTHSP